MPRSGQVSLIIVVEGGTRLEADVLLATNLNLIDVKLAR